MKKRTRFATQKLARDNMLERCEQFDIRTTWKKLSEDEHIVALKNKLVEEAQEVVDAKTIDELVDELADVKEVLDVLITKACIAREMIEQKQQEKSKVRGSFQKGIYMEYVDVPQGTDWHEYFSKDPKKYPVIEEDIE